MHSGCCQRCACYVPAGDLGVLLSCNGRFEEATVAVANAPVAAWHNSVPQQATLLAATPSGVPRMLLGGPGWLAHFPVAELLLHEPATCVACSAPVCLLLPACSTFGLAVLAADPDEPGEEPELVAALTAQAEQQQQQQVRQQAVQQQELQP